MNEDRKIHVPQGGPPQDILPDQRIYSRMGEEAIYQMLEDFYLELESSSIRSLFPSDMREASKRSAAFFVFILGGPPLYQQQIGPPRMRQRHLPFTIDEEARLAWMNAFKKVLLNPEKYNFPMEYIDGFVRFLDKFSEWMVNTKK